MPLFFDPEEGVIGTVVIALFFIYLLSRSGLLREYRLHRTPAAQA